MRYTNENDIAELLSKVAEEGSACSLASKAGNGYIHAGSMEYRVNTASSLTASRPKGVLMYAIDGKQMPGIPTNCIDSITTSNLNKTLTMRFKKGYVCMTPIKLTFTHSSVI